MWNLEPRLHRWGHTLRLLENQAAYQAGFQVENQAACQAAYQAEHQVENQAACQAAGWRVLQ